MVIPVLEAKGVVKSFGSVQALRGADFAVNEGEIVALVGDNGAGKSTLIKTLAGVITPDRGEVLFDGTPVHPHTPERLRELGVETVYQDLALAPTLDPTENLFLGREVRRPGILGALGFIDRKTMRATSAELFRDLGVRIQDVTSEVSRMSGGQRQGIAVARAAAWASRVIFLDEPTAALGVVQTRNVLDLVRRIRDSGIGVVLISHNMPDVFSVSDRIDVLRLGSRVAQFTTATTRPDQVISAMTGADVAGFQDDGSQPKEEG